MISYGHVALKSRREHECCMRASPTSFATHRLDPVISDLKNNLEAEAVAAGAGGADPSASAAIKDREKALIPVYQQVSRGGAAVHRV